MFDSDMNSWFDLLANADCWYRIFEYFDSIVSWTYWFEFQVCDGLLVTNIREMQVKSQLIWSDKLSYHPDLKSIGFGE